MKYIAFLRGINVGGKNIIKMANLKTVVEQCGMSNVSTYIQSGNVVFETAERDSEKVATALERAFSKAFSYESTVVVLSHSQLKEVIDDIASEWRQRSDLRKYIAYIKKPTTADDVLDVVKLREGIDFVKKGVGVLYMSTLLSGITKSGFTKLIGTKVYKNITIRNYATSEAILMRIESKE